MDVAKVAKDYFLSSQSSLLIPNREYGSRKLVHVGITRSTSGGSVKLSSPSATVPDHTPPGVPTKPGVIKGLLGAGTGQGRNLNLRQKSQAMRSGNKQWLHPPDALLRGHILYTVRFLGECTVEQPKGTEVVKDAIRKMKFNKHIKRAEGQKPPKVDLTISSDAVKVLNPKTRIIMHQYPLHRISYCADDKSDKRMFTFIAKAASNNEHFCYVFDSEKCAEEITLTIGQAFDLAYKRFLESSASDSDIRKQYLALQKKVHALQFENDELKKRVVQLEKMKDRSDLDEYMRNNQITDFSTVVLNLRESSTDDDDSDIFSSEHQMEPQRTVVGRRLENLGLKEDATSSLAQQTNGRHHSSSTAATPILSPPPVNTRTSRANSVKSASSNPSTPLSGSNNPFFTNPQSPTTPSSMDPFGMPAFNPAGETSEQEIMDIQAGFSRGLSFGTDDFSLDDLDPLNQKL